MHRPDQGAPTTFWSPNGAGTVFGSFKGALDFSRYSTYYAYAAGSATNVGQLIAALDSGTKPDKSGDPNCSPTWDATGDHDPTIHDTRCDVPNWFYYAFGGTLGTDTPWDTAGRPRPAGQSALVALGNRPAICPTPAYILAPSCGSGNDKLGDWIEATNGDIGSNFSGVIKQRIQDQGNLNDYSGSPYPNTKKPCVDPGGPSESNCYGKALTVTIIYGTAPRTSTAGTGRSLEPLTTRTTAHSW